MLTALYIDDEWGEDILLFEEFCKAREWLAQYCADRNEKPEDVCHFIKEVEEIKHGNS